MRCSVKATIAVSAAALMTATCTAAAAPAATHIRAIAENGGKAPYGTASAIVAKSTASDPGCTAAESAGRQMANTFNADDAAISRDQNNGSARRADLQRLVADLQSLQSRMTTAEARARHQSVRAGIAAMISDLTAFRFSLQAIENGGLTQGMANQMATAAYKAQSDGRAFQTTCTTV